MIRTNNRIKGGHAAGCVLASLASGLCPSFKQEAGMNLSYSAMGRIWDVETCPACGRSDLITGKNGIRECGCGERWPYNMLDEEFAAKGYSEDSENEREGDNE